MRLPFCGYPFRLKSNTSYSCQKGVHRKSNKPTDQCVNIQQQVHKNLGCPVKGSLKEIEYITCPEYKICDLDNKKWNEERRRNLEEMKQTRKELPTITVFIFVHNGKEHQKHNPANDQPPMKPETKEVINKLAEDHCQYSSKVIKTQCDLMFEGQEAYVSPTAQQIQNAVRASTGNYKMDWDGDVSKLEAMIEENKWNEDGVCVLDKKPFFFFRQTKFMKMLLMKYGHNAMLFMDATHKFTKYQQSSLFYIVVKTNEGFKVVAMFIVNNELQSTVQKALETLKEHNPTFKPAIAMVDYHSGQLPRF